MLLLLMLLLLLLMLLVLVVHCEILSVGGRRGGCVGGRSHAHRYSVSPDVIQGGGADHSVGGGRGLGSWGRRYWRLQRLWRPWRLRRLRSLGSGSLLHRNTGSAFRKT